MVKAGENLTNILDLNDKMLYKETSLQTNS